jgi:hypothetical protein
MALNVYLCLDGSDVTNVITVPPAVSFHDLKGLVEKNFGHAVILRFIAGHQQIFLDDDNALRRFFRCHQERELKIFCTKVQAREDAMGAVTSHSPRDNNGIGQTSDDTVGVICSDFTYIGSRVLLPQLTDAGKNEADLRSGYADWATPSGRVVNEAVAVSSRSHIAIDSGFPEMPDVTIFDKDSQSVVSIAAIIELTDPSAGASPPGVSSDSFKRLAGYLRTVLDLTPGRTHVYGILTNHRYLVWVKAKRAGTSLSYVLEHAGSFREDFLQWILHASLDELGLKKWEVMIDGRKHMLKNYLGSGKGSIDFEVEHPSGQTMVVKYFADPKLATKERDTCGKLKGIGGVMQLADVQLEHPHFVALTPKGFPFNTAGRQIRKDHVRCLRRVLRALHRNGLAHNNVQGNIYYIDETSALLSDWSSVTEASPLTRRNDFACLYSAVEALGGSVELRDYALHGSRKRLRFHEEEEKETGSSSSEKNS